MNRKMLVPIVFSDGSEEKKEYRLGEVVDFSDPSINPSDQSLSCEHFIEKVGSGENKK